MFTDFGWDMLHEMRGAGFAKAEVGAYWSERYGYVGAAQLVFKEDR